MVTHDGASTLMYLIKDLSYIYERSRATLLQPAQYTQVKGKRLILDALKRQIPILERLAQEYPDLEFVKKSAKGWVSYLEKRYKERRGLFVIDVNLNREDAKKLAEESDKWIGVIIDEYSKTKTVFMLSNIFPDEFLSSLDELTREDLKDALGCVLHLLPTPGAMVCFRATENIVRQYYEKITGKSHSGKSWKNLLKELEDEQKSNRPLIGYLDYLRDKRNEAEHPDKRFTQEESERVLLQTKGLLEELRKIE